MIIIGYQGIGKSALGGENGFIDLESSNFNKPDGSETKILNWHVPYCNVANDLSSQGYNVFVSCHKQVRDYLKKSKEKVVLVFPALELEKGWFEKLKERYNKTHLSKDRAALTRTFNCYSQDITDLMNEEYEKIVIESMEYSLKQLLMF